MVSGKLQTVRPGFCCRVAKIAHRAENPAAPFAKRRGPHSPLIAEPQDSAMLTLQFWSQRQMTHCGAGPAPSSPRAAPTSGWPPSCVAEASRTPGDRLCNYRRVTTCAKSFPQRWRNNRSHHETEHQDRALSKTHEIEAPSDARSFRAGRGVPPLCGM